MEQIIGRKKEIELLTEYYHSGKAELWLYMAGVVSARLIL